MDLRDPGTFLVVGYLATVLLETPVLVAGLSRRHSLTHRLLAGAWLTACTYPVVVLVLPALLHDRFGRGIFLLVAEIFAPAAECALFGLFLLPPGGWKSRDTIRDFLAIIIANLFSFLTGEVFWRFYQAEAG